MRFLLISLFSLIFLPLSANAVVQPCKNKSAKQVHTNATGTAASNSKSGPYICVHTSKYYYEDNKCSSGYKLEGTKCKKYKAKSKSCKVGQKLCSNSYCVGALKACKSSNKKGSPSSTCTGAGWREDGSQCSMTKDATDTKCPVGWFKAAFGPSSSNSKKFYCKTNR